MATKTFNLAFDDALLREVDAAVKQDMASRSEYFRRLARADLRLRKKQQTADAWAALDAVASDIGDAATRAGYASDEDFARLAAEIRASRQ